MSSGNDPNELLICPYDPAHRVAAKRFPYHLQKCRKVGEENKHPGIVNRTFGNRTQSNSIELNPWIEFD